MPLGDKVPVAMNCWVVPTAMVGLTGVTTIVATVSTAKVAEPVLPANAAVIGVEPMPTAVASPEPLMVAIPVSDELHVANVVKSWDAPFDKLPVAINCCVVSTAIVGLAGVTAIELSAATVNVVDPEMLPEVAVMVVEPKATPVASPVLLMVATFISDELHVADVVRSRVDLFEKVPMAANCRVVPTAMLGLAGVIEIDTKVGGGEGSESSPPSHPLITGKSISNAMPKLASFAARVFILFLLFLSLSYVKREHYC